MKFNLKWFRMIQNEQTCYMAMQQLNLVVSPMIPMLFRDQYNVD